MQRKTGRHPEAQYVVVRLIEPVVDDLERMRALGQDVLRATLKKLLKLREDPEMGQPLVGNLSGWRKLVIGDRTWRLIWRVTYDTGGDVIVDVAEVWAVGARSDNDVYTEMRARALRLGSSPAAVALEEVLSRLGVGAVSRGEPEPARHATSSSLPTWLVERLVGQAGYREDYVLAMSFDEALAVWEQWMTQPRPPRP